MSALPSPPDDVSIYSQIDRMWTPLHRRIMEGKNVAHDVTRIERAIGEHRRLIDSGRLTKEIDWESDFRAAERFHSFNVSWMEHDITSRSEWISFWQTKLKDNSEFIFRLATDGIKFILITHGAVAIVAINGLVSNPKSQHRLVLLVSLFGAAIGLTLAAGGKIVLIESVSAFSEKIRGRLIHKKGWRSLRAIHRYSDRYFEKYARWGSWLIYGSIVWFVLYAFTCLLMLAHS